MNLIMITVPAKSRSKDDGSLERRAIQGEWVLARNNGEFERADFELGGSNRISQIFRLDPITLENLRKSLNDLTDSFIIFVKPSADVRNNFALHERN